MIARPATAKRWHTIRRTLSKHGSRQANGTTAGNDALQAEAGCLKHTGYCQLAERELVGLTTA